MHWVHVRKAGAPSQEHLSAPAVGSSKCLWPEGLAGWEAAEAMAGCHKPTWSASD